ncbi:MAG TPA: phosphotransferase [Solirubrobacteraceae bacterium]|nr:phosphotransferase [Solirubrobacteraceae bacterium]
MSVRVGSWSAGGSRLAALAEHLRIPLYRDGYALVLNSGLTAVLGLVYWLLAAREYSPHVVGVNTAIISAMMFLAGAGQLNLISAVLRFVPVLGTLRRRFITVCYGVAVSVAVGCAVVFLVGVHVWAPDLRAVGSSAAMVIWFIGATAVWCIFALQDSALTALGAAVLVPVENVVYGIAKLALLVVLASISPRYGIFGSWSAALLISIVPVNALIFGRLLRRRHTVGQRSVTAPTRAEIVRFAAPDYLGALLWLAAVSLMPVIVVAIAGATSNAFFSLAWMITLPLIAVSSSTGQALVVTGAGDPARLAEYARKVLAQTARLVIPAALVLVLGAPYVLRLFGGQYAHRGATTLSLLALSAIPNMITALYVSIYRVQRRMRAVVMLLAALCGSVLLLGPALLAVMGIKGVGLAWLVCQSIVAIALLSMDSGALAHGGAGTSALAGRLGVVAALRRARARRFRRRNSGALAHCLPEGLALTKVEATVNDVAVGCARPADGTDEVIVKLALSDPAGASLRRAAAMLSALGNDARAGAWEVARPQVLAGGLSPSGRSYLLESRLSGVPISRRMAEGAPFEPLANAAIAAIAGLHERTAEMITVDSELLDRWIDRPARAVGTVVARSASRTEALDKLTRELRVWLAGRRLSAGWVHGDFVPENVLIDPQRAGRVTGIIDWELATICDLGAVDTTMFLLAAHSQLERRELGRVVAAVAGGQHSGTLPAAVAEVARGLPAPQDPRLLVLLCWLRHAASLITKSERYAHHPVWKRYNVNQVLDTLVRT